MRRTHHISGAHPPNAGREIPWRYTEEKFFYADLSPVVGSEQGGVRPVLIVQNEIGNRFWQSLGWKYCDNVNYYEYVLNEENITVFNP